MCKNETIMNVEEEMIEDAVNYASYLLNGETNEETVFSVLMENYDGLWDRDGNYLSTEDIAIFVNCCIRKACRRLGYSY